MSWKPTEEKKIAFGKRWYQRDATCGFVVGAFTWWILDWHSGSVLLLIPKISLYFRELVTLLVPHRHWHYGDFALVRLVVALARVYRRG